MKYSIRCLVIILCFWLPAIARAQSMGQVECPRNDGYVYLYSSMTTLDVRATLQCGEQVQITVRYDGYFGVRTQKGETGFVPQSSILLIKDQPGSKTPQPKPQLPARPRTAYDDPNLHPEAGSAPPAVKVGFALPNGIPIHLKLSKSISSATAHVGDQVELEVVEEVDVDGLRVIAEGAPALGVVTEAEPKKRMGHGGKLGVLVKTVRLSDDEKAAVRSFQESAGSNSSVGTVNPLAHGKDVEFTQGTEFTAYVDGDMPLKREAFQATKAGAGISPAPIAKNPSPPPGR
jgi:hypothetical protein